MMKAVQKIIKVYLRDLKRLSRNVVALVVAMGICILPALYAWFNIAANWDPYGSTSGIKVAVVNNDKGYSIDDVNFQIGDQIIENLKANDAIGWTFVDEKKAMKGVKGNDYYAAIVIPEDFSEKMASVLSGTLQSPTLDYYINDKMNAIAPKITDKGATAIQEQVNSTFISTAVETAANTLNVTSAKLDSSGGTIVDRMVSNLKTILQDLNQYSATIDAFINVTDSVSSITRAAESTLPDVQGVIKQSNETLDSTSSVLKSSRNATSAVTNSMSNVLNNTESTFDTVESLTNSALQNLGSDANFAAGKMQDATAVCEDVKAKNNEMYSVLSDMNAKLIDMSNTLQAVKDAIIESTQELQLFEDSDLYSKTLSDISTLQTIINDAISKISGDGGAMQKIEEANQKQDSLKEQLNDTANQIYNSTANADEIRSNLSTSLKESKESLADMRNSYYNDVQPNLGGLLDDIGTTTSNISGLLTATSGSVGNLHEVFDGVNGALGSGKLALQNTKSVITTTQQKLNTIISEVDSVGEDEQLQKLVELLKSDPDLMGDFMASPVQLNTTTYYEVENYGSAMAPFYSVLAIWVGAIVLVAIMKVDVDEDDKIGKLRVGEAYLGRYLTFLTFGLIQATVITLGDLFYLRIQCSHKGLFFLSALICSFAFTNIVYALTVSFRDIGKAMAVIILVVQIGGSGGTFPIEMTPPFFQAIHPWLPFTYGINAMREAVAGTYGSLFLQDILHLLLYVPFAVLLGMVLRKPLIGLMKFFTERLEDSKLL